MTQFRPKLWIGNRDDAPDRDALAAAGITAVVNVAHEIDESFDPAGIRAVKVFLDDNAHNPPILKSIAVLVVRTLLEAGETVLVYCQKGHGRSAWVVAQAVAEIEGIDFDISYAQLLKIRPVRKFNLLHPAHAQRLCEIPRNKI